MEHINRWIKLATKVANGVASDNHISHGSPDAADLRAEAALWLAEHERDILRWESDKTPDEVAKMITSSIQRFLYPIVNHQRKLRAEATDFAELKFAETAPFAGHEDHELRDWLLDQSGHTATPGQLSDPNLNEIDDTLGDSYAPESGREARAMSRNRLLRVMDDHLSAEDAGYAYLVIGLGLSQRDAAKQAGVNVSTVSRHLDQLGSRLRAIAVAKGLIDDPATAAA